MLSLLITYSVFCFQKKSQNVFFVLLLLFTMASPSLVNVIEQVAVFLNEDRQKHSIKYCTSNSILYLVTCPSTWLIPDKPTARMNQILSLRTSILSFSNIRTSKCMKVKLQIIIDEAITLKCTLWSLCSLPM
uniref:Uncharacterized protein n=1 Tax=Labrus bergylta TaxID=56723 RepID=A0A3Q3EIN7_9LABR